MLKSAIKSKSRRNRQNFRETKYYNCGGKHKEHVYKIIYGKNSPSYLSVGHDLKHCHKRHYIIIRRTRKKSEQIKNYSYAEKVVNIFFISIEVSRLTELAPKAMSTKKTVIKTTLIGICLRLILFFNRK
jgi:hypothetical protein